MVRIAPPREHPRPQGTRKLRRANEHEHDRERSLTDPEPDSNGFVHVIPLAGNHRGRAAFGGSTKGRNGL